MNVFSEEWYFIDDHIDCENIGEIDNNGRFLSVPFPERMRVWREDHPDCDPIGVCYDDCVAKNGLRPMVYEDARGKRYFNYIEVQECFQ